MFLVIQPVLEVPAALDVTASRNLSEMAHQHMGISVPPNHPNSDRLFHYKASSYWGSSILDFSALRPELWTG